MRRRHTNEMQPHLSCVTTSPNKRNATKTTRKRDETARTHEKTSQKNTKRARKASLARTSQANSRRQTVVVELILAQSRTNALQIRDVAGEFLDRLHLFVEEFLLEIVGQVGVVVTRRDLVELEEALVDGALECERILHRIETRFPLAFRRGFDRVEHDATAATILVFHQFLGVFLLFLGRMLEEFVESLQRDVVAIEVVGLSREKRDDDVFLPAWFRAFIPWQDRCSKLPAPS